MTYLAVSGVAKRPSASLPLRQTSIASVSLITLGLQKLLMGIWNPIVHAKNIRSMALRIVFTCLFHVS